MLLISAAQPAPTLAANIAATTVEPNSRKIKIPAKPGTKVVLPTARESWKLSSSTVISQETEHGSDEQNAAPAGHFHLLEHLPEPIGGEQEG